MERNELKRRVTLLSYFGSVRFGQEFISGELSNESQKRRFCGSWTGLLLLYINDLSGGVMINNLVAFCLETIYIVFIISRFKRAISGNDSNVKR